jgi:hypothetical protein
MDWLFDVHSFITRNQAGPGWTAALVYIYKFSNLVIACSYFSIPAMLMAFWQKRRNDMGGMYILVLFAAFIFSCGLTHLTDILVFYWPAYRLFTLILAITAFLSFLTACALPSVILEMLKLPSREIIHEINGQLQKLTWEQHLANISLEERNAKLAEHIKHLEDMLENNAWMHDKSSALKELKEMLLTVESTQPKDV